MEKIQELANSVRAKISDYCYTECHAYCCRKGYLMISEEELNLIVGEDKNKFISEGSVSEMINGKFRLDFSNSCGGCPQLKDFKCMIHTEEKRPQTCKDFPIFILGKKIKISNRCPAKKAGKFYFFEKEATDLGYEIVEEFF